MKIRKLRKQSETGYTFAIGFGPFWVRNWWYNPIQHNVVPPSVMGNGKRYCHVLGHGMHFVRLRDLVAKMVAEGVADYDSDDMVGIGSRPGIKDISRKTEVEVMDEDEMEMNESRPNQDQSLLEQS